MKLYDKNYREIKLGDTLKIFHFIGARHKKYYMYKFVKSNAKYGNNEYFEISHLDVENTHYNLLKNNQVLSDYEIVQGFDDGVYFEYRPKLPLHEQ